MRPIFLSILFLSISNFLYGQSSRELCAEAASLMDNKQYDKAVELLQKAERVAPNDATPPYEMGMVYYLQGKYTEALPFFRKSVNGNYVNITDLQYAMLGNCYDLKTDSIQAVKTYEEGRKRFPNSGRLWTEEGNLHYTHRNYDKALCCFETAAKTAPEYASAFRNAASVWSMTEERFHCMMFAERFMNLEPGGKRNEGMSKMLYETLNEAIVFSDTSAHVTLTKNMVAQVVNDKVVLPQAATYELGFMVGFTPILIDRTQHKNKSKLTLAEIVLLYTGANEKWFSKKGNKEYPNDILERQKKIIDQKLFEAYVYWLFRAGNMNEYNTWMAAHQSSFESLKKWMADNPVSTDKQKVYQSGYACQ